MSGSSALSAARRRRAGPIDEFDTPINKNIKPNVKSQIEILKDHHINIQYLNTKINQLSVNNENNHEINNIKDLYLKLNIELKTIQNEINEKKYDSRINNLIKHTDDHINEINHNSEIKIQNIIEKKINELKIDMQSQLNEFKNNMQSQLNEFKNN
jgi:hypothetical protein